MSKEGCFVCGVIIGGLYVLGILFLNARFSTDSVEQKVREQCEAPLPRNEHCVWIAVPESEAP